LSTVQRPKSDLWIVNELATFVAGANRAINAPTPARAVDLMPLSRAAPHCGHIPPPFLRGRGGVPQRRGKREVYITLCAWSSGCS